MGLFEAIGAIQKMADDPRLTDAAKSLGEAALAFPKQMETIIEWLKSISDQLDDHTAWLAAIAAGQDGIQGKLVEISLGLDGLADPIKRPPFSPSDVEAAIAGAWPAAISPEETKKWALTEPSGVLTDLAKTPWDAEYALYKGEQKHD